MNSLERVFNARGEASPAGRRGSTLFSHISTTKLFQKQLYNVFLSYEKKSKARQSKVCMPFKWAQGGSFKLALSHGQIINGPPSKWLGDFIQSDEFEDVRDFQYPSSLSEACLASVQELQVPSFATT